jgi:hypothetical protein
MSKFTTEPVTRIEKHSELVCTRAPHNSRFYTVGKSYKVQDVFSDSIVLEDDTYEGRDHVWYLTKLDDENYEIQFELKEN